jgi:hypothetical protein
MPDATRRLEPREYARRLRQAATRGAPPFVRTRPLSAGRRERFGQRGCRRDDASGQPGERGVAAASPIGPRDRVGEIRRLRAAVNATQPNRGTARVGRATAVTRSPRIVKMPRRRGDTVTMTQRLAVHRRFNSVVCAIAATLTLTPLVASSVPAFAQTPTTSVAATHMTPLGNSWR